MNKVDIIIPIYNSLEWLKICVEAVVKNTDFDTLGKIYLIDDCSNNDTKEYLKCIDKKYGEYVKVIYNEENLGFVKTCNKGIKISKSDFVLLLNTDCVISKNAIEKMMNAMTKDKKIGLLCPISSVAANLSYSIPEGMNFMQINEVFENQFSGITFDACTVVGNCLMISRKCIDKVGPLDEVFGKGYTEETDYQFKSMSKGFKAKVLIDTFVYHQSRVTFGESEEQLKIREEHLKIFFKRWGNEYNKLMERYQKNDPIKYIKDNVDYSNISNNEIIKVNKKTNLDYIISIINKLMLEGININIKCKSKLIENYKGIMLFSPIIVKNKYKIK